MNRHDSITNQREANKNKKSMPREQPIAAHEENQRHTELEMQNQELREIHERLEYSRDRYADLYDFAPIGYVTLDDKGIISEINLTGATMLGAERTRLLGMPLSLYVSKNEVRKFRAHLQRCRQSTKRVTSELTLVVKGEQSLKVQLYSSSVNDACGAFTCRTAITDITELKQTEEALRESRKRYRIVADYTYDWEYWQDNDMRLIYISPSCERITGYSPNDFLSDHDLLDRIIHPDDQELMREHKHSCSAETGEVLQVEFRIIHRDGSERWIGHLCQPVPGEGKSLGRRCSNRDITAQKRALDENQVLTKNLAARASELEEANRELEAFSYTVSHDLRSPLTNINGSCQVLLEICGNKLDQHCKSFISTILEETKRMGQLITTLLDFSRLTQGEIKRGSVDLSAIVATIANELSLQEPRRHVAVHVEEGVVVDGDERLLRVVMQNLLSNAWKYTGKKEEAVIDFGTVTHDGQRTCFIRDNGIGLDMTSSNKIFSSFNRARSAEDFEGTGVGLATVERIIRRHGGRIWAEGAVGEGAAFYFTTKPAEKEKGSAASPRQPQAEEGQTKQLQR